VHLRWLFSLILYTQAWKKGRAEVWER
jgi:hypothetical protein